MERRIYIQGIASVSSLGFEPEEIEASLNNKDIHVRNFSVGNTAYPTFPITQKAEEKLNQFLRDYSKYKKVDRTAQLAMLVSEQCLKTHSPDSDANWVINSGSSRGATHLWEQYHEEFINEGEVGIKASPLTTTGNISSHIAQHLKLDGFQIDHSITCSSGLQAMANGFAWLQAGLCDSFLCNGSEAPLTGFTIAQMVALGIYSKNNGPFPCMPCASDVGENTFVLGEASVSILLGIKKTVDPIYIAGIGTGSEKISSPASISKNGEAFTKSMQGAMKMAGINSRDIQVLIPHSPGTFQGDKAEYNAINQILDLHQTKVINHKFLTGHTLGTSGLLSVDLACRMLKETTSIDFPYPTYYPNVEISQPTTIMINAMGFGGNALSIILKTD